MRGRLCPTGTTSSARAAALRPSRCTRRRGCWPTDVAGAAGRGMIPPRRRSDGARRQKMPPWRWLSGPLTASAMPWRYWTTAGRRPARRASARCACCARISLRSTTDSEGRSYQVPGVPRPWHRLCPAHRALRRRRPQQDARLAGCLVNSTRQVGSAIGLAVLATTAASVSGGSLHPLHVQADRLGRPGRGCAGCRRPRRRAPGRG